MRLRAVPFAALLLLAPAQRAAADPRPAAAVRIDVDWATTVGTASAVPSLQVVPNPLYRRGSKIHDQLFAALRELGADHIRYVHWLPYPHLSVAELAPPRDRQTAWDFALIDPLVLDFMAAVDGRRVMANFSVIPQWMFVTPAPVPVPADPDTITWTYQQGTELRDPSGRELGDYYARLLGWYTAGGFVDELGRRHDSPHHIGFDTWEVFNEPNGEHTMTAEQYTRRYDAIVAAVRPVAPGLRFAGPAVTYPTQALPYIEHFLDPANHAPGVPVDVLTYHFYAVSPLTPLRGVCPAYAFEQNRTLAETAARIEAARARLRPQAETAVNEIGAIAQDELKQTEPGFRFRPIPAAWWNLSAAVFAHQFGLLTALGVDVVGQSALAQYPGQFASVAMLDWETGRPNARYRVLELLIDSFGPGDRLAAVHSSAAGIYAQAFHTRSGARRLLLVNQCDRPFTVALPGATQAAVVDQQTGGAPPASHTLAADQPLALGPFAVAVVTLGEPEHTAEDAEGAEARGGAPAKGR